MQLPSSGGTPLELPQGALPEAAPPEVPAPPGVHSVDLPRPRKRTGLIVVISILVAICLVALVILSQPSPSPKLTVTYTLLGFEWLTPPSSFCNNTGIVTPGVPFTVNASQTFNVSWELTCDSGGPSTIRNASTLQGATLDWSNVPVTVYSGNWTFFRVTFTAPATSYSGALFVSISVDSP